jgi:hypothetical protein
MIQFSPSNAGDGGIADYCAYVRKSDYSEKWATVIDDACFVGGVKVSLRVTRSIE